LSIWNSKRYWEVTSNRARRKGEKDYYIGRKKEVLQRRRKREVLS